MISVHNVSGASEAVSYFEQDNYYTERQGLEESEWFGKAAQSLGLEGKIDKADFLDVLQGKFGDEELGKWKVNEKTGMPERDHRPGFDLTFSAPKSVSILAEVSGSNEVREAHEGAVKTALGYIERELAGTRQMKEGQLETVKTGNLAVAMFRHNTSRDLDPQTHTHAVVLNGTKREDGRWRSLTNDEIYKAQRVVGAIYTADLASRLHKLGYDTVRSDDKGNFEIKGISREQVEHFSQRRAGMEAAMAKRGVDIKTATSEQKEIAALATRARKVEVDHSELIKDWKQRALEVGIDMPAIHQEAAAVRAQGGLQREDQLTGLQAMTFAAAHLVEREAVVSKHELMRTAIEHGAGRVGPEEVEKAFNALARKGHLIELPNGDYTTKKMLGSEQWAVDQVRDTKGVGGVMMAPDQVSKKVQQIEERQGFAYTPGQCEAITLAMTSNDRFVAVQGLAGTGKTTMLKGLDELARSSGYKVRGMAPTGAASKVLNRETGIQTDTVSMFMIKERQLQSDIKYTKEFAPDYIRQKEIWVVDESSFLSQIQKSRLDRMANEAGAKVVYLGDKLQLQGVAAGKPFELAQTHGIETAQMTEISRQKTPEMKSVIDKLTGRDALEPGERLAAIQLKHNAAAFRAMDDAGMVREFPNKDHTPVDALVKDIMEMPASERERTMIITAFNKDRKAINSGVREKLKSQGELSSVEQNHRILGSRGFTNAQIKEAQYYKPGLIVRFGRDYKSLGVTKGEYANVTQKGDHNGFVTLTKEDGTEIRWQPSKNSNVEVYKADSRNIAVGDLIRVTRNSDELKNGEVGRIVGLEGSTATVQLRGDKETGPQNIDLEKNPHWDHAYATTIHASQGATSHRTFFHIQMPGGDGKGGLKREKQIEQMAKIFGDRSFYVGATRASHELQIYTDSKELAHRAVTGKQDKTSAIEVIEFEQAAPTTPPQKAVSVAAEKKQEPERSMGWSR